MFMLWLYKYKRIQKYYLTAIQEEIYIDLQLWIMTAVPDIKPIF